MRQGGCDHLTANRIPKARYATVVILGQNAAAVWTQSRKVSIGAKLRDQFSRGRIPYRERTVRTGRNDPPAIGSQCGTKKPVRCAQKWTNRLAFVDIPNPCGLIS